jgi:two-component system, response regulator
MHGEILLIDNNFDSAQFIITTLKQINSRLLVEVARDDHEALDFLGCRGDFSYRRPDQLPAMILLDLDLPDVDSLDVLRKVRSFSKSRNVPIVMITEQHNSPQVVEGLQIGAASCLIRDRDSRKFAENIMNLGQRWIKKAA